MESFRSRMLSPARVRTARGRRRGRASRSCVEVLVRVVVVASAVVWIYRRLTTTTTTTTTTRGVATSSPKMRAEELEECEELSTTWVDAQRAAHARRVKARADATASSAPLEDFLFFLHVPRTAGRSYHFCFLKPAFERSKQCGNMYNGLDFDPNAPECDFLATHDDFSLVERFSSQPRVVTMLRSPYERVLSSYEFAIEVAARSFDQPPTKSKRVRVQTRDVWPWGHLVRHIDGQLERYLDQVEKDPQKMISIGDVYENDLYTPFEDWTELEFVQEDVHNGQFFQLLGLTNNTNLNVEPKAKLLRKCALWRGTKASKVLIDYAKERLEHEVDSLAMHERLDDSLRLSARELSLPLNSAAHIADDGSFFAKELEGILRKREVQSGEDIVAFTMRWQAISADNLQDLEFYKRYFDAVKAAIAAACEVDLSNVTFGKLWEGGWHTILVRFNESQFAAAGDYEDVDGTAMRTASKTPGALHDAVMRGLTFDVLFKAASEDFSSEEKYGRLTVIAGGRVSNTTRKQQVKAETLQKSAARTLGEQYRICESGQFAKYGRLRERALQHLSARIKGTYETFSHSGRLRISQRVRSRVKELNWLDDELWRFGAELFKKRFDEFDATDDERGRDYLPPRLAQ